ncbi:alpha-2-macroglobulin-like protein 1 isoform X2 [Microcaecilia unicolor]|uniref:Alpha-2-macroglobulin-like protein 1 isoform X2 n=1 Tax=Microcaecilia unicolor TaxID=1415580 RepID=A0A6P7WXU2_9AMPH|nr:alpha-2-macroglobulin-like protein 1 isoform X2 [Microcaecilia unicolor]
MEGTGYKESVHQLPGKRVLLATRMWTSILAPCALLLQLVAAGSALDPYYAVVVSAELPFPGTAHVCVHLAGLQETVQVSLTLNLVAENITVLEKTVTDPVSFTCSPFQVPAPSEAEEIGFFQVEVHGDSVHFNGSKKILVKKLEKGIFVQTDKAFYKPGQTVKFRIVTLDKDLIADNHEYPMVELQDPNKNRIGQWLNVAPRQGIVDLSFPLSSEPPLGTYTIAVGKHSKTFIVEEYVPPKFEVQIELPSVVTVLDENMRFRVCAKYTYGKMVPGKVEASLCRSALRYGWWSLDEEPLTDICLNFTGSVDQTGCFSTEVSTEAYNLTRSGLMMRLEAKASLEEEGTGVKLSAFNSCPISSDITTITFKDSPSYYKAGLPYSGWMELQNADGSPRKHEKIYLFLSYKNITEDLTYVTDENGKASFDLDTSQWGTSVSLRARSNLDDPQYDLGKVSPRYQDGYLWLNPFFSKSKSFLKIHTLEGSLPCPKEQEVVVDYIIQQKELQQDTDQVTFMYLVVSRQGLALFGTKDVLVGKEEVLKGSFSFLLPTSMAISPLAKVLIYALFPDGEMVADTADFQIAKCFNNKVDLSFSTPETLPGSDTNLHLQAAPGSLCAVRAVDYSMVLLKPEAELTVDTVYNLLPTVHFGGYFYRLNDNEPYPCDRSFMPLAPDTRRKRSLWWYPRLPSEPDTFSLFKSLGLKLFSNANIKKPISCHYDVVPFSYGIPGPPRGSPEVLYAMPSVEMTASNSLPKPVAKEQQVRKYFPETWIWDLYPISESGTADVSVTAPDTITDWKTSMFCTADIGFGLSPAVTLRTFKPYFVEVTLPYSVVREESFLLKATVVNYQPNCIKIQVTLAESQEFKAVPCADCQYTSCLCADQGKTFSWEVTATKLGEVNLTVSTEALKTEELCGNEVTVVPTQGRVDTIIKPLLVKPGGVLVEKTNSFLLCTGDTPAVEEVSLKIPENILEDSERARMSVLGDIMGTALQNIDQLIQMPYGCGEQNMVKFSPNIFTLEYLEKTDQLIEKTKSKAVEFLKSGYQRQLNYKHDDGSYSAFGKSDPEGNTWLTSFVIKSFGRARPYIFVDDLHIQQGVSWLKSHQLPTGCFQSVGKLFHTSMKGGVNDDLSLSSYITGALLDLGIPASDPITEGGLRCLKAEVDKVTSMYTQALMAYTFTLAGENELRQVLLEKLEKQAVKSEGQMHWEPTPHSEQEKEAFWYRAPSAEVETSAYVLLAYMSNPQFTKEDVGKATEMVNWLTKQQNAYGGFSSTQDTVVALQGLAKYASATYSKKGDIAIRVKSKTGFQKEFHVDNSNRLLLQETSLPEIPGEYVVEATGDGCAYVQASMRYNIPPPKSDASFELHVETVPGTCSGEKAETHFDIHITARYTGDRTASNMAIIEAKMLSGFIPVKRTIKELEKTGQVKKTEVTPEEVVLYLEELTNQPQTITFSVEQDILVKGLKPATVKVYDYYKIEDHDVAEYSAPCSTGKSTKTS